MSKVNTKKETLEKKEAMREINDNEVKNVSGGSLEVGGQYVSAGYIDKNLGDGRTIQGKAYRVSNTKEEAEKFEKDIENQGYTMLL